MQYDRFIRKVKKVIFSLLPRYMTIDKVPDCIGVMKFERVKDGDEKEKEEEVDMDWSKSLHDFPYRLMSDIHIHMNLDIRV